MKGVNRNRTFWCRDPRRDVAKRQADGEWWADVLALAYDRHHHDPAGAFGVLRGLRCMGAWIADAGGRLVLMPPGDEDRRLVMAWAGETLPAIRDILAEVYQKAREAA